MDSSIGKIIGFGGIAFWLWIYFSYDWLEYECTEINPSGHSANYDKVYLYKNGGVQHDWSLSFGFKHTRVEGKKFIFNFNL